MFGVTLSRKLRRLCARTAGTETPGLMLSAEMRWRMNISS